MGELGYGTRGPLAGKLKQLTDDIQAIYEEFLDAETLYQQGKISDKDFFRKMGAFLKVFSSLGFLTVKVVVEINNAIGKDDKSKKQEAGVTTPSPTYTPDMMPGMSTPLYSTGNIPDKEYATKEDTTSSKACSGCGTPIPAKAKFCTKCGVRQ